MIDRSSNYSIKHGQSTPLKFRVTDTPLTVWMPKTLLTFILNIRHSSSVADNNCLHVATYVFGFNRLCYCNFILIGMIVTNSGYSL